MTSFGCPLSAFWQDSHRNEVDLVYEQQCQLIPIEIKSAMTWNNDLAANLRKFLRGIPAAKPGFVLYAGEFFPKTEHSSVRHFSETGNCLRRHCDSEE